MVWICHSLFNQTLNKRLFSRVFPIFSYYQKSCYVSSCTDFCVNLSFHFSYINAQECSCWVTVQLHIQGFCCCCYCCCLFVCLFVLFLKNCQTVSQSGFTILCSHEQCIQWIQFLRILTSIWCCHYFYFRHSDRCVVVLIHIPLMVSDVEYLFMYLFAIFGEMSLHVLCTFSNWVFFFFIAF